MLRNLAILFLATAVMAQTPAAAPKKPAAKTAGTTAASKSAAPKSEGAVTDDTPVIFVPGLCNIPATAPVPAKPIVPKAGAPPQAKCMRQVTKREFEALVKGLGPRAAAADPVKIADFYAHALAIENQARKLNLEQDPDVREALWMARIGALGEALHKHYQAEFEKIPESELQAYYDKHKQEFEEATVQRVVIPKPSKPAATVTTPAKPGESAPESPSAAKANDQQAYADKIAALKATAEKMIDRAKAGEDMAKLQKEAFTAAGINGNPPDVEPVAIHHGMLPPAHDQKVFALDGGQYTGVIEEPNAFMFYKVVSKRTVPLADVKKDIVQSLATEKEDATADQFFGESKPVLNPDYFKPQQPEKPAPGAQPETPQAAPPQQQPEAPKAEQPQQAAPKQEQPSEPPKQENQPPK